MSEISRIYQWIWILDKAFIIFVLRVGKFFTKYKKCKNIIPNLAFQKFHDDLTILIIKHREPGVSVSFFVCSWMRAKALKAGGAVYIARSAPVEVMPRSLKNCTEECPAMYNGVCGPISYVIKTAGSPVHCNVWLTRGTKWVVNGIVATPRVDNIKLTSVGHPEELVPVEVLQRSLQPLARCLGHGNWNYLFSPYMSQFRQVIIKFVHWWLHM